jgi:hypothetical protein
LSARRQLGPTEVAILTTVAAHPGLSSNALVRLVGERRGVVLAVLRVLHARGAVRPRQGPRGAQHWYPSPRRGVSEGVASEDERRTVP